MTRSAQAPRPIALIILDGWGYREDTRYNPTKNVSTPTIDRLYAEHPHTVLEASGPAVGLPPGQMGNSEVGHLHIGAGRKVPQDLTRINTAIDDGSFFKNAILLEAIHQAKKNCSTIHVIGLLSAGGVHSLDTHIMALIRLLHDHGVHDHSLHAILDGRDTPPRSAESSIRQIESVYHKLGTGRIASMIGRYYAMDRDQRWDRIQKAYRLLTEGIADACYANALEGLEQSYQQGFTDEFMPAMIIGESESKPSLIGNKDVVIFMNFRADRARQLSYALTDPDFSAFKRSLFPQLTKYVTLTAYEEKLKADVAFGPLLLKHTLGEVVSQHGLRQLRIAETEKYAHVTYFMNGGQEVPFPGEDRILIPSPLVATYDLQPQMSAYPLTEALIKAIDMQKYDLIICNYANADMVGHTGNQTAALIAVTTLDHCLAQVLAALQAVGGEALITADHGNIECMFDESHQQPHTAHTQNVVPFLYYGRPAQCKPKQGALDDIAPTVLDLLGLKAPAEMTGHSLLEIEKK